jgi:hypothetical protein
MESPTKKRVYDPCFKNITTFPNEFMKKRIVPDGIKLRIPHPEEASPWTDPDPSSF